jgi:hypothetical protein
MAGIKVAILLIIVAAGLLFARQALIGAFVAPAAWLATPAASVSPAQTPDFPAPAQEPVSADAPSQIAAAAVPATEAATPIAAAAPVLLPTVTPTLLPATPSPVPSSAASQGLPLRNEVALAGVRHAWQTWNNCGPATLAMNLSFYGSSLDQAAVGAALRPFEDDKNVSPDEMAVYAQAQGFYAQVRVNGDAETLRQLLSNGFPVLIETWLEPEPDDGMGHYRLLTGYDHAAQRWIAFDSYDATNPVSAEPGVYEGIYLPYAEMDALWAVFNRTYLLVYPPEQEAAIRDILGDAFEDDAMWQAALAQAQAEVAADAQNPFAWFNLGTNLVHVGDHAAAAAAYDQARAIGLPWRMLWYQFGPFAAYHAVGRYADILSLADAVLAATTSIEEIHYWRGLALAGLDDDAAARAAWQAALDLNPAYAPAQAALAPSP